jgi:hypothetical protein
MEAAWYCETFLSYYITARRRNTEDHDLNRLRVSENKNRMLRGMFGPEKGGENWKMSFVIFILHQMLLPSRFIERIFLRRVKTGLGACSTYYLKCNGGTFPSGKVAGT